MRAVATVNALTMVKMVKEKAEFDAEVASGHAIVDAFATWCGPCVRIAPQFQTWSEEYKNVKFVKFDVDESGDIAEALGVEAMPTFFIFKDGKQVDKIVGANTAAIEAKLKEMNG